MTTDTHRNICPKCQSTIPADAPGNLCPRCVMATLGATTDQPRAGLGDIPSIEQLAAIFPQLEIIELIGRGGMGFVFKARQLHLDREVALKLLPEKLGTDPHFADRFTREARVLAKLNHPNIVMVHDFGFAGGFYFLTMEYVEGMNLRQAMRMGKFSPAEALAIVPKICDALQFAHEQGILHRDIKPENLLLDVRGRVKIADFGIAKLVGEENKSATLTGTGASLGTPHYMAPEQFENPGQVDHRADIYSLGVVFYEMLTGELPLGRFSAPSARAELDERIDAIVLRALARERDLRQKDARQLQTEVETVASTQTPPAGATLPSTSPHHPFWRRYQHKLAWSAAAAVLLVLIAIILLQQSDHQKLLARFHANSQPTLDNAISVQSQPSGTNTLFHPVTPVQPRPDTQEIRTLPAKLDMDPALVEEIKKRAQSVADARARYEEARAQHARGEITDRQLALFNRDVLVAEARGDKLAIAKAHYDFLEWEYHQISNGPYPGLDHIYKLEVEMNKAHHAIERAKAGTNTVQIAFADLKYAERAWGIAQRRGKERIERNGIVTNFLSEEILKKRKDDLLYAQLHYHQVKQKAESTGK